jgi:hypothetical protein
MYSPGKTHNEEYAEMTINEIMNGSEVSDISVLDVVVYKLAGSR